MEGTEFGRYRLEKLLGRGGMGEVWRARDTATDRTVAIKVLLGHWAHDEVFQKRFRREAHAVASLNEPHIVPIHDYGEIDGQLFVDMRLIEGQDLQSLISSGPIEPGRSVNIVAQIAMALEAAHSIGLTHRDIKPSNILVGKFDFAYLIDFGIAHASGQAGLTSTGSTIGTWHYMAPERFESGHADARADIYALTCVLYECLTGSRPFPGESVQQQIAAHLMTPPPLPSRAGLGIPSSLDAVISKGMAKDPSHRYQSALQFADSARAALTQAAAISATPTQHAVFAQDQPISNTHQAPAYPTIQSGSHPRRPIKTTWIVAGAVGLVAIMAAMAALVANGSSPNTPVSSPTTTSSLRPTTTQPKPTTNRTTTPAPSPSNSQRHTPGSFPTIASYIQENGIREQPVKRGDPGAPTIDLPFPDGWKDAGADTPEWAYGAIIYAGPESAEYTPSIVALVSKLTGNVDPQTIIEVAGGELKNLPGYTGSNDGMASTLSGFSAYQLGGTWVSDGQTKIVAQKTVVIPGRDGLYVLQLNADGVESQMDIVVAATDIIDSETRISP